MDRESDMHHSDGMGWGRFAAMILTSTAVMVELMYQLVFEWIMSTSV